MLIHQKINQVMKLVPGVEKTSTNKAKGSYKYAGHEAVNEALRGHFAELGIVRAAEATNLQILEGGTVTMTVRVTYTAIEDDSSITLSMPAIQPSQTSKGGVEAQQIGQCLSYAVKNIEFKLFALKGDTEPDSDGTAAVDREETEDTAPPAQATQGQKDRAGELLTMLTRATSIADVDEVKAMAKKEWPDLANVRGFRERLVEVSEAAQKRLGA